MTNKEQVMEYLKILAKDKINKKRRYAAVCETLYFMCLLVSIIEIIYGLE